MAQVVVQMSSDEQKLWAAQQKLIAQQEKMERKYRDVGQASQRAGRSAQQAGTQASSTFASARANVTQFASAMRGPAMAATGALTKAMADLQAAGDRAVESMDRVAAGERRLLQVSDGPADFERFRARTDELAIRHAVPREQVQSLLFSARSEEFESAVETILRASPALDPVAAGGVAGQLPTLFRSEGISPEQAINAALQASRGSRLDFERIAAVTPSAAEGTAMLGGDMSETLGALSVLASSFASGETAAQRMRLFATQASLDERLQGQGLMEAVRVVRDEFSEAERQRFLGSGQGMNVAFSALVEEFDAITDRTREVQQAMAATGTEAAPLAERIRIAETDPQIVARRARQQEIIRAEVAEQTRFAVAAARVDEEIARRQAELDDAGISPLRRSAAMRFMQLQRATGLATALEARDAGHGVLTVQAAERAVHGVLDAPETATNILRRSFGFDAQPTTGQRLMESRQAPAPGPQPVNVPPLDTSQLDAAARELLEAARLMQQGQRSFERPDLAPQMRRAAAVGPTE